MMKLIFITVTLLLVFVNGRQDNNFLSWQINNNEENVANNENHEVWKVKFTVHNNHHEDITMFTDLTPFAQLGIDGPYLKVQEYDEDVNDWINMKYKGKIVKRMKYPHSSQLKLIKAGESLSTVVDLADAYVFQPNKKYRVSIHPHAQVKTAIGVYDNGETFIKDSKKHLLHYSKSSTTKLNNNDHAYVFQTKNVASVLPYVKYSKSKLSTMKYNTKNAINPNLVYEGCTEDRANIMNASMSNCVSYMNTINSNILKEPNGCFGARGQSFFGSYSWNNYYREIHDYSRALIHIRDDPWIAKCNCNENYYAYVYPDEGVKRVHFCNAFWNSASTDRSEDSRPGTIVHEHMHYITTAGTDDHAYGVTDCTQLANDNPDQANDNSDNKEYFFEDPLSQTFSLTNDCNKQRPSPEIISCSAPTRITNPTPVSFPTDYSGYVTNQGLADDGTFQLNKPTGASNLLGFCGTQQSISSVYICANGMVSLDNICPWSVKGRCPERSVCFYHTDLKPARKNSGVNFKWDASGLYVIFDGVESYSGAATIRAGLIWTATSITFIYDPSTLADLLGVVGISAESTTTNTIYESYKGESTISYTDCALTCPTGKILSTTACECVCENQITCANGGTFDQGTCQCDCSSDTQYNCKNGATKGPTCACTEGCSVNCKNGGSFNANLCECDCPSDTQYDCQNGATKGPECACTEGCNGTICERSSQMNDVCACDCSTATSCANNAGFTSTCGCNCQGICENQALSDDSCNCDCAGTQVQQCINGGTQNSLTCGCDCTGSCKNDGVPNSYCKCTCGTCMNNQNSNEDCSCDCQNTCNAGSVNTTCGCECTNTCAHGIVPNPLTCECDCTGIDCNGGVLNAATCECSNCPLTCVNGGRATPTCGCDCSNDSSYDCQNSATKGDTCACNTDCNINCNGGTKTDTCTCDCNGVTCSPGSQLNEFCQCISTPAPTTAPTTCNNDGTCNAGESTCTNDPADPYVACDDCPYKSNGNRNGRYCCDYTDTTSCTCYYDRNPNACSAQGYSYGKCIQSFCTGYTVPVLQIPQSSVIVTTSSTSGIIVGGVTMLVIGVLAVAVAGVIVRRARNDRQTSNTDIQLNSVPRSASVVRVGDNDITNVMGQLEEEDDEKEWSMYEDDNTGVPYYVNNVTGERTWDPPVSSSIDNMA